MNFVWNFTRFASKQDTQHQTNSEFANNVPIVSTEQV